MCLRFKRKICQLINCFMEKFVTGKNLPLRKLNFEFDNKPFKEFVDVSLLWSYLLNLRLSEVYKYLLHGDSQPRKGTTETTTLSWVWRLFLSSNQIKGFPDHQYLWKKSTILIGFFHGDSHQAKVASRTTSLVGCGQLCLSSNQIAGFLTINTSRKVQVAP